LRARRGLAKHFVVGVSPCLGFRSAAQRSGGRSFLSRIRSRRSRCACLRDTGRAMSQENVEIVRALFDAWNAGNMDAVRECYDRDVILRVPRDWPEPGPWVGREAVM